MQRLRRLAPGHYQLAGFDIRRDASGFWVVDGHGFLRLAVARLYVMARLQEGRR